MTPPTSIVFDLDDTLFAERDYVLSGFRAVGDFLEKTSGTVGFFDVAKVIFERGERGKVFDATFAELGKRAPVPMSELVRIYRGHTPQIVLDAGAVSLLQKLRSHGKKLGVITDGYWEVQREKVTALGVERLVDAVVFSDEWGRAAWKPAVVSFRKMETLLKTTPANCLYVGDNPAKDFLGARNAGWRSIRLRLPGREHSRSEAVPGAAADATAADWASLERLLLWFFPEK